MEIGLWNFDALQPSPRRVLNDSHRWIWQYLFTQAETIRKSHLAWKIQETSNRTPPSHIFPGENISKKSENSPPAAAKKNYIQ